MNSPNRQRNTRGAVTNPPNRFEPIRFEADPDWNPEDSPLPRTRFYRDLTTTIITRNDSPDIGFEATLNPYRGCEHGCAYCYPFDFVLELCFQSGAVQLKKPFSFSPPKEFHLNIQLVE